MRIETACGQMEVVDPQRLKLDVERKLRAASAGRGLRILLLRRAQHTDPRRRQKFDAQSPLEQGAERPGERRILDLQPGTGSVGDLDACDGEFGRHEPVDAGDADLLPGRGGGSGDDGCEKAFTWRGLQGGKGEAEHGNECDECKRQDSKRAHQKACPRLT